MRKSLKISEVCDCLFKILESVAIFSSHISCINPLLKKVLVSRLFWGFDGWTGDYLVIAGLKQIHLNIMLPSKKHNKQMFPWRNLLINFCTSASASIHIEYIANGTCTDKSTFCVLAHVLARRRSLQTFVNIWKGIENVTLFSMYKMLNLKFTDRKFILYTDMDN